MFNQSFYSVMDIVQVINDTAVRKKLIAINKALYADGEFAEYDALYQYLKSYEVKSDNTQEVLSSLYPK